MESCMAGPAGLEPAASFGITDGALPSELRARMQGIGGMGGDRTRAHEVIKLRSSNR